MNEETKKTIGEAADKFAFQVPYNGTNDFYNNDRHEGFIAGATWAITTFNADEQLQDQKGLRWIKASEPIKGQHAVREVVRFHDKLRLIENRHGEYWVWVTDHEREIRVYDNQWQAIEYLEETEPGQPVPAGESLPQSIEEMITKEPVTFFLVNALKYLNDDQKIALRDALIDRTPKKEDKQ